MSDKSSDMNKTQIFKTGHKEVLIITPDGRLEAGEGLSHDEVSRELFKICSTYYGTRTAELERENAALRADIHAHEQINKQLIEDKRRLDFLGQAKSAYYYEGPCCWRINEDKNTDGDTLRDAIDAARKEAQP